MKHASRCAIVSLAALVCATPVCAALLGLWPGSHGLLCLAVAGLALTGLLFHGLLLRQLNADDAACQLRQRWDDEQRARARAETALADTHDALCRLVCQQEQVRETERQRIARDIHDDLGQHLLALKIEVQLARHGTPDATPWARLASNIDQSIAALRTVIDNLRPQALGDGLQVAVQHHLRECSRLSGIDCQLVAGADCTPDQLSNFGNLGNLGDLDVLLLRIVRESLANVVRHAQASTVRVALSRGERDVTLEVRDNGIGMPAGDTQRTRGCGLDGIADRVAAVGGRFAVDSAPGKGTVLSLSIPLPQN